MSARCLFWNLQIIGGVFNICGQINTALRFLFCQHLIFKLFAIFFLFNSVKEMLHSTSKCVSNCILFMSDIIRLSFSDLVTMPYGE